MNILFPRIGDKLIVNYVNSIYVENPTDPLIKNDDYPITVFADSYFVNGDVPDGFNVFINCRVPFEWHDKYKDSVKIIFIACQYFPAEPRQEVMREALSEQPQSKDCWVKCSEIMPDSNGLYLCWGTYFEGGEAGYIPAYFFAHQNNGCTEWQPVEDDCNPREVIITHWMPLPAAPQQEVKNG